MAGVVPLVRGLAHAVVVEGRHHVEVGRVDAAHDGGKLHQCIQQTACIGAACSRDGRVSAVTAPPQASRGWATDDGGAGHDRMAAGGAYAV